jgi:hypothetical protein
MTMAQERRTRDELEAWAQAQAPGWRDHLVRLLNAPRGTDPATVSPLSGEHARWECAAGVVTADRTVRAWVRAGGCGCATCAPLRGVHPGGGATLADWAAANGREDILRQLRRPRRDGALPWRSTQRVEWLCRRGHGTWTTAIRNRTVLGRGCPTCARQATAAARRGAHQLGTRAERARATSPTSGTPLGVDSVAYGLLGWVEVPARMTMVGDPRVITVQHGTPEDFTREFSLVVDLIDTDGLRHEQQQLPITQAADTARLVVRRRGAQGRTGVWECLYHYQPWVETIAEVALRLDGFDPDGEPTGVRGVACPACVAQIQRGETPSCITVVDLGVEDISADEWAQAVAEAEAAAPARERAARAEAEQRRARWAAVPMLLRSTPAELRLRQPTA